MILAKRILIEYWFYSNGVVYMFKFKLSSIPDGKYAVNLISRYDMEEFYCEISSYMHIGRTLEGCLKAWEISDDYSQRGACFALYNGELVGISDKFTCIRAGYKIIEIEEWFEEIDEHTLRDELLDVLDI